MIKNLQYCLTPKGGIQALGLLLIMLAHSLVEITGVVSILPFMMLVSKPSLVQTTPTLKNAQIALGLTDELSLIVVVGVIVFLLLLLGNLLSLVSLGLSTEIAGRESAALSKKLFQKYLEREYAWFLGQNSAILARHVLVEVASIPQNVLLPFLRLLTRSTTAILIIIGMVAINGKVAIVVGAILGGSYALLWYIVRSRVFSLGVKRIHQENFRSRLAFETLTGIKTNMILQREQSFVASFCDASRQVAQISALQSFLYEFPRFIMETFIFGGIVLGLTIMVAENGRVETIIPTLSLFAVGAYRLLPALQIIFSSFGQIRSSEYVLNAFAAELKRLESPRRAIDSDCQRMCFEREIKLDKITFSYPGTENPVLDSCSVSIRKNSSVAFVGSTGSGKTTLVDVLLGLLMPQSGNLWVDDIEITDENVRAWQKNIGYVGQDIFLMDDTIAANVAVGVSPESIDMKAVERACRLANLHEFIVNNLDSGYETQIGDRGIRLSGGQRQRIGIARALYHDPLVLVLDEATSALDGVTENSVMEAVNSLSQKVTLIMVAHRLATVQNCDEIFMLKDGRVKSSGTFSSLMEQDWEFRNMARHASLD